MKHLAIRLKFLTVLIFLPLIMTAQNISLLSEIGHFQKAASFSINETNTLYVLDKGTNEVIKLDSAGNILKKIGGTGWDDYTFDNPADICATILKVFVTDRNNNRIQVYDKDLNFLFSLDPKNFTLVKSIFKYPVSAQSSHLGDIYIADSDDKQILKFNSNWEFVNSFGNYEYGKFSTSDPDRLALDNNSNVYLLDGKRIISFDQYGNGISIFSLAEKPNSIRILNDVMIIAYDSHILYTKLTENQNIVFRFEKMDPGIKEKIVDAFIANGKIYLLTENSIFIYNSPKFEQNN